MELTLKACDGMVINTSGRNMADRGQLPTRPVAILWNVRYFAHQGSIRYFLQTGDLRLRMGEFSTILPMASRGISPLALFSARTSMTCWAWSAIPLTSHKFDSQPNRQLSYQAFSFSCHTACRHKRTGELHARLTPFTWHVNFVSTEPLWTSNIS